MFVIILPSLFFASACGQREQSAPPVEIETDFEDVSVVLDEKGLLATFVGRRDPAIVPSLVNDQPQEGSLFFFLDKGVDPKSYLPAAGIAAEFGWTVRIFDPKVKLSELESHYTEDACTVVGGLGKKGADVFEYGFERRHDGVDGAIVVAAYFQEDKVFKGKYPATTVVGSEDNIVTFSDVASQKTVYPSQTYLQTIQGGNHAGFYPGQKFDGDGEATLTIEEQISSIGGIFNGRMDRFCETRRRNIAEAEREAAREALKKRTAPQD